MAAMNVQAPVQSRRKGAGVGSQDTSTATSKGTPSQIQGPSGWLA